MKSVKRVLMYGHGGYYNHGCEAIVRSTGTLIKNLDRPVEITVATMRLQEDQSFDLPAVDNHISHTPAKYSVRWVKYNLASRFGASSEQLEALKSHYVLRTGAIADVCLSIGGDNYCYGKPDWLYSINRALKSSGGKMVLWGCSIEPSEIDETMKRDLRSYDLITPRETITYHALIDKGIRNAKLHPDPAFTMEKCEVQLPDLWRNFKVVGLNISPLIANYEKSKGMALRSAHNLINHILKNYPDKAIALIPHVTWSESNDLIPLTRLYNEFKDTGRVLLMNNDFNAPQLKGVISKCEVFIGARTHSTIAAYSTNVPTLVLGYSVKARGIARDIFGSEEGLVLPVQELATEAQLINRFDGLVERADEIRQHLTDFIPAYKTKAAEAVQHLIAYF